MTVKVVSQKPLCVCVCVVTVYVCVFVCERQRVCVGEFWLDGGSWQCDALFSPGR